MHVIIRLLPLLLTSVLPVLANGQSIYFNEVVAANSLFQDEDGDYPDWFELYNSGTAPISLLGWTCSDDAENPTQWEFPAITLAADAHLQLWASNKDRGSHEVIRTLVQPTDICRYLVPSQPLGNQWILPDFDDSNWLTGPMGIGYGDGDDATLVSTNTTAVFLRCTFQISDPTEVEGLILDIDYDDGFIAYLNGQELARANISGLYPSFSAGTLTDREARMYTGGEPERFANESLNHLLRTGENVLAIQAHNVSAGSSDLSIIPFLSARYAGATTDGNTPPPILRFGQGQQLHTNFKISTSGETLYLFDAMRTLVDSIVVPNLRENVAIGYPADEHTALRYLAELTPAAPNPSTGYLGISTNEVVFSHPGGPTGPLSLTLSGVDSPSQIHYTLDASPPTTDSPVYTGPISINESRVVNTIVIREGYLPSEVRSRSYLLNAAHDLSVLALSFKPADFFDEDTGIYAYGDSYEPNLPYFGANFWEDWERPVYFSLYETDGSLGADFSGGAKIFGGWSRGHDQRSLSLFARSQYGFSEFDYPFFPEQPYDNYQAIVLRNSGNDWNNTMLRDATLTSLMQGSSLAYQAHRPVATYFNGQYWGIYNMREKVNEHFLAAKWNADANDIDLLEGEGSIIHGDNTDYLNLRHFISTANLSDPANYQYVAAQMDLEDFALYYAAQIYFDNTDWPGNNNKFGRVRGGKWRSILFDTDFGFGIWQNNNYLNNTLAFALEPNGPFWPNPPWATLFFRKLCETTTFRNLFVNRLADELNSRFLPERVQIHIDSLAGRIAGEIPRHYARWEAWSGGWQPQVDQMKNFASQRPLHLKAHVLNTFNLPTYHTLNTQLADPAQGYIQVNSLTIEDTDWRGDYFQNVPIKVTAYARPGYVFSHWIGLPGNTESPEQLLNMRQNRSIQAVFVSGGTPQLVINEINYNASDDFDAGDWVEIYNPGSSSFDLTGWILKDDDDSHSFSFATGTVIAANSFLIVARNSQDFQAVYPQVEDLIGDMDFGLSSNGDAVRLYDAEGNLVDEVYYQTQSPWPTMGNGDGYTLELLSPDLDNSLAASWRHNNFHGSPGRANILVNTEEHTVTPVRARAYPNPFRDKLTLELQLNQNTQGSIDLFDQYGRRVKSIYTGYLIQGAQQLNISLAKLPAGLYYARVLLDGYQPISLEWIKMP